MRWEKGANSPNTREYSNICAEIYQSVKEHGILGNYKYQEWKALIENYPDDIFRFISAVAEVRILINDDFTDYRQRIL